jgi:hypothetical protein
MVDLIFASSGIEADIVAAAERDADPATTAPSSHRVRHIASSVHHESPSRPLRGQQISPLSQSASPWQARMQRVVGSGQQAA